MGVTHKAKAGALLTGAEYEAADSHVLVIADADVPATIARDSEVTAAITALSTGSTAPPAPRSRARRAPCPCPTPVGEAGRERGDAAGAAADPTTVTLTVQAPDGTQTTPTPTSSVTGTWTADVSVTQAGVWWYRFEGTGAVAAAAEGLLSVRRRRVA